MAGRALGRQFGWLWTAYAVSAAGTGLAFDALPLIAILVLQAGPAEVAALAAAGRAAGAVLALPLGPWVEFHRKRPVMVAMDLVRCAALLSVPAAFLLGRLGFAQLLVVAVVAVTADHAFRAAAGAYLKALVAPADLVTANARFEAATWTATALGPPLGGAAIGLFGPLATLLADAASFLLSAMGIRAIGGREPRPAPTAATRMRGAELPGPATGGSPGVRRQVLDGWRHLLTDPELRPLFLNTVLVNGLVLAAAPPLAVLMLGPLGFAPWQYGLVLAGPCLGGLLGSRLAGPLVTRYGRHRVLRVSGTLRVCWPVGLAFVGPGTPGLLLVAAVELALITCIGVYNPVLAASRLERTPTGLVARTLTAWSVTGGLVTAALTALCGLLAEAVGPRPAITAAGLALLATPLLLPRARQRRSSQRA